jgi:FAD synthase
MKTLVCSFARCNPPHKGHFLLISKIKELAKKYNADSAMFLSHTEDNNKNPLPYEIKSLLMNKWTDGLVKIDYDKKVKQPINLLHYAHQNQYEKVIVVCGEDRFDEYKTRFDLFLNTRDYFEFKSVEIVSRGERFGIGPSSYSSSKMREYVENNDYNSFYKMLPHECHYREALEIWECLIHK